MSGIRHYLGARTGLLHRFQQIPGVCGGVSIDGTDCVPHPGDVTSILTQIGATLALDAGDVMPQGINGSYCPN